MANGQPTQPRENELIEAWVRALYPDILRYCLFHTVNRGEAEDAAQETFLKAIRFGDRTGAHWRQKALLYRIAHNVCIDMGRRRRADALPEDLSADDAGFANAEADADLALLVSGLEPEARELVLLRFQQELTLREIASVLQIPLRTAQSRLRSALKRIENTMRKEAIRYAKPTDKGTIATKAAHPDG